jgi:calcium-dependent protein kinase
MNFSSKFPKSKSGDVMNNYEILKKLGEGSYGKIYKVKNKKTEEIRAMKQMDKIKIQQNLELFQNEIEIMSILNHPNICKLFEVYEDSKYIYLIIEYCDGGELLDRISKKQKEGKLFNEKEAAIIFKQLIEAIEYIHDIGVVHRDLKPENILFETKYENSPIKIIDFGISKNLNKINSNINNTVINNSQNLLNKINNIPTSNSNSNLSNFNSTPNKKIKLSSKVGTVYYMSPEIIKGSYTELCDVWASGVILYILLCGYPPFSGANDKEIYNNIKNCKLEFPGNEWKKISKYAKELIKKILCPEKNRLDANQILQEKWLRNKNKTFDSCKNVKTIFSLNKIYFKEEISNKIKKSIFLFIVSHLNESEIKNFKTVFENIDSEKKGFITFDELKIAFEKNQINKIQYINIINLFKHNISDNDGKINLNEFLGGIVELKNAEKEKKLIDEFQKFDTMNLGIISLKNFQNILKLNDEDINNDDVVKQFIKINEKNNDKNFDYKNFVKNVFPN